ncbi:DUF2680 domain-containing protein [Vallitalea maricola]|uniref:Uncharacterized protein n=1 Tax=Vallitalea maricola TaxID=3074433 RepID=A0ACB5UGI5_9FIRM|nr:hypothetical protein AN2V17_07950 [Vallitalea sp. AN17-2]
MKFKLFLGIAMSVAVAFGGVSALAAPQNIVQQKPFSNDATPLSSVIVRQNGNAIEQSYDNGVTWENYTYKEANEFFNYDEYAEWVKTEKEAIQKLVEAGEWTQKQADEVISHYNEVLSQIKDGLIVSKRKNFNQDQVLFSLPEGMHTTGYRTVVYNGDTFKNFGPFETKEDFYNALKEYSDGQVTSGIMSQSDANDLLKKYE